jgi:MFS family permease
MVNNSVMPVDRGKANGISASGASIIGGLFAPIISIAFSLTSTSTWPFPFNFFFAFLLMSGVAAAGFAFSVRIPKHLETPPEITLERKESLELTDFGDSFGHHKLDEEASDEEIEKLEDEA